MKYSLKASDDALLVTLSGSLTLRDHEAFNAMLAAFAAATTPRIVVDMADLEFIDSAGLGMFHLAQDESRRRGKRIVLRNPKLNVRRLLEVACFHTLFVIEP